MTNLYSKICLVSYSEQRSIKMIEPKDSFTVYFYVFNAKNFWYYTFARILICLKKKNNETFNSTNCSIEKSLNK